MTVSVWMFEMGAEYIHQIKVTKFVGVLEVDGKNSRFNFGHFMELVVHGVLLYIYL